MKPLLTDTMVSIQAEVPCSSVRDNYVSILEDGRRKEVQERAESVSRLKRVSQHIINTEATSKGKMSHKWVSAVKSPPSHQIPAITAMNK